MLVQPITNMFFVVKKAKSNKAMSEQSQTAIQFKAQPACDMVSFKGNFSHSINSTRKFIDYGDIFKPSVNLVGKQFPRAKKELARLMNANLESVNFVKSTFHCANFEGANLKGTNFESSSLDGSWFIDVITGNTNLKATYLNGAIFSGEFGPFTILEKSNVMNVNFKNADMENLNLSGAIYDEYTEFPHGFEPKLRGMIFFKKNMDISYDDDLERMKLRFLNFNEANFEGASLKRVDFKGCLFDYCNMCSTNMTRAYAKESIFVNCDLSHSKLKQLNLDKAYIKNTDMSECDLRGAILTWRDAKDIDLKDSIYDKDTVFNKDFNPKAHGMIFKEDSLSYYGLD